MTEEEHYRAKLRSSGVPAHMHDGYVLYLLHGIPPGSFAQAVLENDLREALGRADETNRHALYQHVEFLYNYAPSGAWGSPAKVNDWINRHARQRREEAQSAGAVDPSVSAGGATDPGMPSTREKASSSSSSAESAGTSEA